MNDLTEIAWAAGILDGEGSFFVNQKRACVAVTQAADNKEMPEMLARLLSLLGGDVYGPYKRGKFKPWYQWRVFGEDNVEIVLLSVWPWLGNVKREQAIAALRKARLK